MLGEPLSALMSQPLTYESPSQLQIIYLHTNIHQMKLQESVYLKKLVEKEADGTSRRGCKCPPSAANRTNVC